MVILSFLAICTGFIFSLNSFLNAGLAKALGPENGPLFSSWFAHASGTITGFLLFLLFTKYRPTLQGIKKAPWWSFTPGIIGILIVVLVNWTINSPIGLSGSLSLMLLGQTLWSRIADSFGLLGLIKRPLKKTEIIQTVLTLWGSMILIFLTKNSTDNQIHHHGFNYLQLLSLALPLLMGISSGILIGLTQVMNARLAQTTTPLFASLTNHLAGLVAGLPLICFFMNPLTIMKEIWQQIPLFYTLGGSGGIIAVALSSFCILKLGASKNTLFLISGMMISSTTWDAYNQSIDSIPAALTGLLLIILGTLLNRT